MELEISPTPTEAERKAIEGALREIATDEDSAPSPWWQAGVRENLDAEVETENP